MRAILFILILAVVALILAVATGLLRIDQTRQAQAPGLESGKVSGGQMPSFDVETGSVSVSTEQRNAAIPVPNVDVTPPGEQRLAENASSPAAARE